MVDIYRLPEDEAAKLVQAEWAPHEAKMYTEARVVAASPPRWRAEVAEHPAGGPSDTAHALRNRNRASPARERNPAEDLKEINRSLATDDFRLHPPQAAEGAGLAEYPEQVDPALVSLWRRSEMRTPLIVPASLLASQGAARQGIRDLAEARGTSTVTLLTSSCTAAELESACEDALNNGKWVTIVREPVDTAPCGELPDWFIYRHVALRCLTVTPDAETYPRRELFRVWVVVPEPVDLNDTNYPSFPTLFSHQALQLCRTSDNADDGRKVVRKLPADPLLLDDEVRHRIRRAELGVDEDAESVDGDVVDNQTSPRKLTGPLFVRSLEMHEHTSPERAHERMRFAKALGTDEA